MFAPLLMAACGGAATPSAQVASDGESPARAAGPSFSIIDWGSTPEVVRSLYPTASGEATLTQAGDYEGESGKASFLFREGGLNQVIVEFNNSFESMDSCGTHFAELRAGLDQRFGKSSEDNLAAYWVTPTASVTLSCGTIDGERAAIQLSYSPPEPQ